ncbi:MAG: hypothetical protein GWN39_02575, partial [Thermoplasmata archaeon]|nr:hypothetical protein [Gemmatimonadota bacterium]NIS18843.1 hypothetical protein [Thermoplasmata archaeon]NIT75873.1 hypothetical protein [Thermoplasmata archaeon]NIV77650.1 hypothetical protein [Thermoplasmata archaeon]NIW63297.1 hypothetical protein [Gemmatimonadota bacterium]
AASALSTTSISLTWSSSAENVDEFEIERAQGSAEFSALATLTGDVGSYQDEGLTPETSYRYRIRACNDGACSSFSAASEATTFGELSVTTTTLPDPIVGLAYDQDLTASGGDGDYGWQIVSGFLPSGLSLSGAGTISGTPDTEDQTTQFTVEVTSGDDQTATQQLVLSVVPQGLAVKNPALPPGAVDGPYDVVLEPTGGDGVNYAWSLVSGSLPSGLSFESTGRIQGTPAAVGSNAITVEVSSGGETATADFTVEIVPNNTSAYDLTPVNVVDVSPGIQNHVDAALTRWEEVITGDLAGVTIAAGQFSSAVCGGFGLVVNGTSIDDILILVNIAPIDGAGSILGQAGPCVRRDEAGDYLPVAGFLTLDEDDLAPMVGTDALTDLIVHEIGHILGFGTVWELKSLVEGTGDESDSPTFTGNEAITRWQSLGGSGNVPVENDGGAGTADSHWEEEVFKTELMTGFSNPQGA